MEAGGEGSERLATEEELMIFFSKPNTMGIPPEEIRNPKYSYQPPVDLLAIKATWLGGKRSIRLPSTMGTRTDVDLKGRSVSNKDFGESSETMMENSNPPAADSSATTATSGTNFEAIGGSIQNHDQISETPNHASGTKAEANGGACF